MEKSKNEMAKIFIRFLKDEDAYSKFKNNYFLLNSNFKRYNRGLDTYLQTVVCELLISMAFDWDSTTEGIGYWHLVEKKWIIYLRKYNIFISSFSYEKQW